MLDSGNEAQARVMLDNVAQAAAATAILKYRAEQLDAPRETPVPPLVKWLVGAIGGLGSAALIGLGIWLVSSVSTMRETLARMDERQVSATATQDGRFEEINRRLTRLEQIAAGDEA